MKEKLVIKNFGPIKSVELELGRFNVLIGEQATGKSTIVKLLAVCRYFSYIVDHRADEWFEHHFISGLKSWGLYESLKKDTVISYYCKDYEFNCQARIVTEREEEYGLKEWITVNTYLKSPSIRFQTLLNELESIRSSLKESNYPVEVFVPTSFFQNDVSAVMDNPFFFPTERGLQSIFSLGKTSVQNISDSLYNQFAQLDKITRLFKIETEIEPLDITYKNENGSGFTKKQEQNDFYSVANGASGYQSTIPIILSTRYYTELRKKSKTFIIEEPEMNLFPSAQKKLVQYLIDRCVNYNCPMFLTTHSPYILTSINNFIYAHKIGQTYEEEANKIIEKKYWLNPDDVSVYMMLPDGTCEDIFDREEGLIKAEKIDGISGVLNKQFDDLLDIEFSKNEFNT